MPRIHVKKPGVVACILKPCTGEAQPARLAHLATSKLVRNPVSTKQNKDFKRLMVFKEQKPRLSSGMHAHASSPKVRGTPRHMEECDGPKG